MKPYYQDKYATIYLGDCLELLPDMPKVDLVLTDPPFNQGYHYKNYSDNLSEVEYLGLINRAIEFPAVLIHYPENSIRISMFWNCVPNECIAWVYNGHTPKKWRMISWFGVSPDLSLGCQDFKNKTDKRIVKKIKNGINGAALYDWWECQQVKNVSIEKTDHPCQMPLLIMKRIVQITLGETILDPFMGSGTTLVAAKQLNRKAIGIEIEEKYCEVAAQRLSQEVLDLA